MFPIFARDFFKHKPVFNCLSIHNWKHTWHTFNMISHVDDCFQSFVDPTCSQNPKLSEDPVTIKMLEKFKEHSEEERAERDCLCWDREAKWTVKTRCEQKFAHERTTTQSARKSANKFFVRKHSKLQHSVTISN